MVANETLINLNQLSDVLQLEKYPKGHVFFEPDQWTSILYLIREGKVRLHSRIDGSRHIVTNYLGSGSFFGTSVLRGRPHHLTAEAVTLVEVYAIEETDIHQLQKIAPALVRQLLLDLSKQLEHIQRVYIRTPLTTPARLAGLLLLLMDEDTNDVAGFSHQHLAEMLGTHREFVTQTLANFRDKGIVETGYKRLHILDPRQLRSMSGA